MKKTTSLFSSLALVATLLIANPGLARMNGNQHNPDSNWNNIGNYQMEDAGMMTPEQQAAASAIENGYADRFAENDHETRARVEEMILLMADDQTTLAEVNSLRAELYLLKQERRQLRSDMNQEVSDQIGTPYHDNDADNHLGYDQLGMTDDNHTYPSGLGSADDSFMNQHNDYAGNNYHAAN